jgi:hypothetical protein
VGREDRRPQLSSALTVLRLRTRHGAENIGSVLKGGVNVVQRPLVNEVLGALLTEFVRNFGREGATSIQHSSNANLLGRVEVVKLTRHKCAPTAQVTSCYRLAPFQQKPGLHFFGQP